MNIRTTSAAAAALMAAAALTCAAQSQVESIQPTNVTTVELQHRSECLKLLTRSWPANEKVVYTRITRLATSETRVGVNLDFSMDQATIDKALDGGVRNTGMCFFENGHLKFASWRSEEKREVFMASAADGLTWRPAWR